MSQPPVPGRGLGEEPARGTGLPGGPAAGPGSPRDLGFGDFATGGWGDTCPPGPALAATVDTLSGPGRRCDGATDEELVGLLGRWAAQESWSVAGKLGVLRALIRRRGVPVPGMVRPGGLPELWEGGTGHKVAAALGISLQAADKLLVLAWTLEARLPGVGEKLADGTITYTKAKIIADELSVLDDAQAAVAEKLILDELAGKTPGQIGKLAALAVVTVDPEGALKRREQAEREDARVRFWREHSGTGALAAYGLPPDAALAANANVNQRAETYKKAKVAPDATMDQLRALAFLDILNGISVAGRITQAQAQSQDQPGQPEAAPDDCSADDNRPSEAQPADPNPGLGSRSGEGGPENGQAGDRDGRAVDESSESGHALPAKSNLTLPLATLLGMAERPGLGHGLGPLDPALVCDIAAAAARSPHSEWCVTITDANGYAIGHGCCKPGRSKRGKSPPVNGGDGPWTFTQQDDSGPPGGFGTWLLTMPDGRQFTVKLGPIPVTDCDHRHESHSYEPSDTLRHLVEIRDGECTFPSCSRHAHNCDFEHATPYDKGGRTCGCNAGARSRRCHKVKQSKGWSVTQPRPGWHQWETPSGRTYTQGPMKYPALTPPYSPGSASARIRPTIREASSSLIGTKSNMVSPRSAEYSKGENSHLRLREKTSSTCPSSLIMRRSTPPG